MASAAPDPSASPSAPPPGPPPAEPHAIRAALSSDLAAEFDQEWSSALERAKESQDLAEVHGLINKWRHTVYLEARSPGAYRAMLAKAEEILRTGHNPAATSIEDHRALIRERLGR
ncbi:hypothetical protein EV188_101113 [Actinomycetospora succinea]|uniref:Uncharacterized protein n=1 Tax=Actinomycetospora succinea TaxID=663603 RepID=A0A4R6VWK3_9PSEU|nr:DUF6247 family protein [Actinomycetospora succinea]TDQ64865.1 hypothetical protein EV188_101113 [Actinomycetospora succinea]